MEETVDVLMATYNNRILKKTNRKHIKPNPQKNKSTDF